jgi:3'-phosphoadenosine 5'-phosphosulfate sulfotransferase (PAPS reductase)/FAD synthetase
MKNLTYVAYGMGVDSTAMLVGMHQRGERPDLIMFADTGDEKPETYAYLPIIDAWLAKVGFPPVTVVKNPRPVAKDKSLSESCFRNRVLPALAYGRHQCSLVWKRDPQMAFLKTWQPAIDAKARGDQIIACIGYDAGARDSCRSYKAVDKAADGYTNRFPLIEWGWDRERCKAEIAAAGLPVPMKSACWHCPASKKHEIDWLQKTHPELAMLAIEMEYQAKAHGLKREGLGMSFSWRDYIEKTESALKGGVENDNRHYSWT